jgi:BASS family bile acid:Na+ symporter
MPIGILFGFLFHDFLAKVFFITPWLVFSMLFITMSNIKIKEIRISSLIIVVILFQVIAGILLYLILRQFNEILAQGAMIIIIAPMATTAPVIANILGAKISTMVSGTLLSNLTTAIIAPIYFSLVGIQPEIPFFQSFWNVLSKITPLIVFPLLLALLINRLMPKISNNINKHKSVSIYLWVVSLSIVIGSTVNSIYKIDRSKMSILFWMVIISILICTFQFAFGRLVGKRYGEIVAGGQSVGQKNTVLAIWMAQTYMNPISSVIPATYVLWQNLFNSYQLWQKKVN